MSGASRGLSRRSLLSGAAAATALGAVLLKDDLAARAVIPTSGQRESAAAAGEGQGGPIFVRHRTAPRRTAPMSRLNGGIQVGVTLDMSAFPRSVTPQQAFRQWELATGCPPLATKIYFVRRQFPMRPPSKLAAAIARGMTAVLCYEPAFGPPSNHDAQAITASLAALRRAGLRHACVVLYTEPQDQNTQLHVPEREFLEAFRFYAPAVRASGWPVYYNANSNPDTWAAYYPGDAHCDGVAVDDYARHYNWQDIWARGGIARIADAAHKPFGWFEMGRYASRDPAPLDVVAAYLSDATAYLANRVKGGRPTGPVTWYNGNGGNSVIPLTLWPSNRLIAQRYYPAMYHALT